MSGEEEKIAGDKTHEAKFFISMFNTDKKLA